MGYLWHGARSNEQESKLGKMLLADYQLEETIDFKEGEEPAEFWDLLGGQEDYRKMKDMMLADSQFEPMLFEVSNKHGYMHMQQIPAFSQYSLIN